jgi:hypothetical protein
MKSKFPGSKLEFFSIWVLVSCWLIMFVFGLVIIAEGNEAQTQTETELECMIRIVQEAYPDDVIYVGDEVYIVTESGKIEVVDNSDSIYREVGE